MISCSDKNLGRSALFSGKAMKFDQFLGSGTSRFSIARRIGLLVLLRLFYSFFHRMFPIPVKKTSIRWQNFPISRTARRKMSDRSPKVRLSLGLPNETNNARPSITIHHDFPNRSMACGHSSPSANFSIRIELLPVRNEPLISASESGTGNNSCDNILGKSI